MKSLPIIVKLAWRNLWRNHRRTLIMVGAVTIGAWAMIFMTALLRGMVDQMVRDGVSALPGHVQIHHPGFIDDPSVDNLMPAPDARILAALDVDGVVRWTSRVRVPAVISSVRESRGVTLIGIHPAEEREMSFVADDIVDGRFLEAPDDRGIIVGRKMLDNLETNLGKRIVIMSQDPANEIVDRGFRIVGVFESKIATYEEQMVFAGRDVVQQMLRIGGQVSEIAVLGKGYRSSSELCERIDANVDDSLEVKPWDQLDTYLGSMLPVMDGFVYVWIVVVFLALSFGLVNTLVMAVFERVREIGLMLALGMKPGTILGQIIVESLCLLVMGLGVGNALAIATVIPLRDGIDISIVGEGMAMFGAASVLYPKLLASDVIMANVIVLVLGFLASLSPAWRASRYEPIEAITKV
ncbi:MAG: ABC transporter permease [Gammaproteobacteria bacterium]|nr:ABC transporter permease [Gammaproteobacteria bacterium]